MRPRNISVAIGETGAWESLLISEVEADITISWGREQLTDAPRSRSITLRAVVTAERALKASREWITKPIYIDAVDSTVRPPSSTTLYMGHIDEVKIEPFANGRWTLEISSVEAWSWDEAASGKCTVTGQTLGRVAMVLNALTPAWKPTVHEREADSIRINTTAMPTINSTRKIATEVLTCARPGAKPSWSADHQELWPTTWGTGLPATPGVVLPARHVRTPATALTTAAERAYHLESFWGGVVGDKGGSAKLLIPAEGWQRGRAVQVSTDYRLWNNYTDDIGRAAELFKAQATAPRSFTLNLSDLAARGVNILPLLWTWEARQTLYIPDDPIAKLFKVPGVFRPMGGTLSIKRNEISHRITCMWLPSTLSPVIPPQLLE